MSRRRGQVTGPGGKWEAKTVPGGVRLSNRMMHFTPDQARELAAALVELANEIDPTGDA